MFNTVNIWMAHLYLPVSSEVCQHGEETVSLECCGQTKEMGNCCTKHWTVSTTFVLSLPPSVLWPAYWSLFLTWRTSCYSPCPVREVTLWWSREDSVKSSLLSFSFHLFSFLACKRSILTFCFSSSLSISLSGVCIAVYFSSLYQAEMFLSAVNL